MDAVTTSASGVHSTSAQIGLTVPPSVNSAPGLVFARNPKTPPRDAEWAA